MTVYGFIGAGNMAGAIVRGTIAAGTPTTDLLLTSAHDSAAHLAQATGARHVKAAADLVAASDVVVLAVKPHMVPAVLAPLSDALAQHRPLVLSIAAGLTTERLAEMLPPGARVVRAMPNMAAAVRQSMTALAAGTAATDTDLETARSLLASVGRTLLLAERDFSAFTALAGSSPAFVFQFIDALARGGVAAGLPKAQAVEIVTQAVLGSALTIQAEAAKTARSGGERGRSPADLIDAVSSPGGTTVAGLVALERAGFSAAVVDGVEATIARDQALGA
ncbi:MULTISPECIES: pyrroline-5-carboxylate reductase [unclassified Actinomyces]|uniref:pyrroline-5-carboxylate reductase n=1 Tax=unclassified Actinomyces TaxID=2609248 RepID=UPI0013A6A472|nr:MULTISPECIES: pyrroline-5-carboxylate reductase [unclassified Actinomyces]MBW3069350.1 pyrroline-5-carboxylate reductase [Actinomyces sp. 594]NDR53771.1 pyrroline-5-carboxylate reductase [Actinomyces sp. 565]